MTKVPTSAIFQSWHEQTTEFLILRQSNIKETFFVYFFSFACFLVFILHICLKMHLFLMCKSL